MEAAQAYSDFYFMCLRKCGDISSLFRENGAQCSPETEELRTMAFMGLMREGVPYTARDDEMANDPTAARLMQAAEEPAKKKKKGASLFGAGKKPPQKGKRPPAPGLDEDDPMAAMAPKDRILTILRGADAYECRESELRRVYGKAYDAFMAGKPKEQAEKEDGSPGIFMGSWGEDDEMLLKGRKKKRQGPEEEPEEKASIPLIENDTRYADDPVGAKPYDSFLFNQHQVTVMLPKGRRKNFLFYVYPLMMSTDDAIVTDIFVAVNSDDGRLRTKTSAPGNDPKEVSEDFGDCRFTIRGSWKDGDFVSKVILLQNDLLEDDDEDQPQMQESVVQIRPTKRTSSFYMRMKGAGGGWLDVFPIGQLLKNDPTSGIAPAAVVIEDGMSRKSYTAVGSNIISAFFDGGQKDITICWMDNDLTCTVADHIDSRRR